MLRPELVRSNPVPLNPDAFAVWSKWDKNFSKMNLDVLEATHRLHNKIIPEFASYLDEINLETNREFRLIEEMHRAGIKYFMIFSFYFFPYFSPYFFSLFFSLFFSFSPSSSFS